jgi:hypothetical protein
MEAWFGESRVAVAGARRVDGVKGGPGGIGRAVGCTVGGCGGGRRSFKELRAQVVASGREHPCEFIAA